jgi:hypothetical protein
MYLANLFVGNLICLRRANGLPRSQSPYFQVFEAIIVFGFFLFRAQSCGGG